MSETREISVAALASITTGKLLCKFREMHEAAEYVMGHQIWNHHFASKELWEDMRKTVLAQHPNLPTKLEGVTSENYREHLEAIEAEHGKTLQIAKGGGLTAMLPTDGIPDRLKDKTILVNGSGNEEPTHG